MLRLLLLALYLGTVSVAFAAEPQPHSQEEQTIDAEAPPVVPIVDKKRWKLYHPTKQNSLYYDVKSLSRRGSVVSYWTAGIAQNGLVNYKYVTELNCSEGKYTTPLTKAYSSTGEEHELEGDEDWRYIEPESSVDKMREILCTSLKSGQKKKK